MLRRLVLTLLAPLLLAWPAGATWSIVVVNRATGEVAIGAATCLARVNLTQGLPVIVVGKGAGAIQAFSGGESGLLIMFDMLMQGADPQDILDAVKLADPRPQTRQIGITGMVGSPVTFTGSAAGAAKGGVVGEVGDIAYAIQGNVLANRQVLFDAEAALIATPGDTAQRMMAAMEAARAMGGDGRCSCSLSKPQSCGAPPPSFTKSAHCGFLYVSRIGDTNGTCVTGFDCLDGKYYMKLNVRGANASQQSPDPVVQLRQMLDDFRERKAGTPDALLSTVESVDSLPADGVTQRTVVVRMVDLEGVPLTVGGDLVTVAPVGGGTSITSLGPVTDHGDGSYSFTVTAGTQVGTDTFAIVADPPSTKEQTLYPYLTIRSDPVETLHAGYDEVSASAPTPVPFVVTAPRRPGARYAIVASLTGTHPGSTFGDVWLPLNPPLVSALRAGVDGNVLPGTVGHLDANGRAEAGFAPSGARLLSLVGQRIDWSAVVLGGDVPIVSPTTGFDIVP